MTEEASHPERISMHEWETVSFALPHTEAEVEIAQDLISSGHGAILSDIKTACFLMHLAQDGSTNTKTA